MRNPMQSTSDNAYTLATPAVDDADDAASLTSKHSLQTLAPGSGEMIAAVPAPNGGAGRLSSSDDDDEVQFRNTITSSRSSKLQRVRPLADSDDEPDWANLQNKHQDGSMRITVNSVGDNDAEIDAETKAMIMQERRRVLVRVGSQMLLLFLLCAVAMGCTLWLGLPVIDDEDRPAVKIPKSFDDLKALNDVLQRYKKIHSGRVFFCWVVIYIFLQAFSIPGSMYMSILAGAIWGVAIALPLVVCSIATGATMCYLISRQMGEVLVAMPAWKMRVDSWKRQIGEQDNLLSYLIIIRMMPVPPHFVVNLIAPHLGIAIPMFWLSTALGVTAVSFIHVTIGQKLDEMTSPSDFKLLSWHNFFLLAGVGIAVCVPIALRRFSNAAPLEEPEGRGEIALPGDEGVRPTLRGGRLAYDEEEQDPPSDDELPSIGRIAPGVRLSGAEDDSSHWGMGAGASQGSRNRSGSSEGQELDAVVHNPFDSDDEDHPPRRIAQKGNDSKAARTLGISNVTNKAAKVLGLNGKAR